jgi:hypothetical protein
MNESFPSTICLLSINTYLSKEFNFSLNPSSVTFLPNPTSLEDAKLTLSVILLISLLVPSDSLTSNEEFSFCLIPFSDLLCIYSPTLPKELWDGYLTEVIGNNGAKYYMWSKYAIPKNTKISMWCFSDGMSWEIGYNKLEKDKKYSSILFPIVDTEAPKDTYIN